jgi:hypothetical protein
MAPSLTAVVNDSLPGSVRLGIADAPAGSTLQRFDGIYPAQYVRNYDPAGGAQFVIDCEAPLGRECSYAVVDSSNTVVARSGYVTCPAPANGWSLVRSVLAPSVFWMWVEPADETGVEWASSTTSYPVVGSDTPIVVSEVRQQPTGVLSFYCKSILEVQTLLSILKDGTAVLVRHSPCAGVQTRDQTVYPLDVREVRWGRKGGRLVAVNYQATKWVPGATSEPPFHWTFGDLRDSAPNFAALSARFASFGDMALNNPRVP